VDQDPDAALLSRLRAGDEQAFVVLVRRHHDAMLRLACGYVPSVAVAEEVVQDTWLGVLRGIGGFEGRSSVRTWLFRILVNRARTTGARERRSVAVGDPEPAVDRPGSTTPATGRRRRSAGSRRPTAGWTRRSWPAGSARPWATCRIASGRS